MAPQVDLSEVPKPISNGKYAVRIKEAEEGHSKPEKGSHALIRIHLETDDGQYVCSDVIMLAGRGAGMGVQKLKGFGINVEDGDSIITDQLVGRKAIAAIGSREYKGEHYPEVSLKSDAPHCGYWPYDAARTKATAPAPVDPDLDVPF